MDTRTGKIYELENGETPKDLAAKMGGLEKDFVALGKLPDATCPKCGGRGSIRRGFFSKRLKPCDCTK